MESNMNNQTEKIISQTQFNPCADDSCMIPFDIQEEPVQDAQSQLQQELARPINIIINNDSNNSWGSRNTANSEVLVPPNETYIEKNYQDEITDKKYYKNYQNYNTRLELIEDVHQEPCVETFYLEFM